jgi:hypothetical protein
VVRELRHGHPRRLQDDLLEEFGFAGMWGSPGFHPGCNGPARGEARHCRGKVALRLRVSHTPAPPQPTLNPRARFVTIEEMPCLAPASFTHRRTQPGHLVVSCLARASFVHTHIRTPRCLPCTTTTLTTAPSAIPRV